MAAQTLTTVARIVGRETLSQTLQRLQGRILATHAAIQKSISKLRQATAGGGQMTGLATTALSAAFLRNQFQIEDMQNRAGAIWAASVKDMKKFDSAAMALAKRFPLTMKDISEAGFESAQAGMAMATTIAVLGQVVKGSVASGVRAAKVMQGVTDVVMGLGLPFRNATEQAEAFRKVNNLLAVGATSANQTYGELLAGMAKAAPVAAATGMSMENLTLMLGAIANAGIKGAKAGTAMRTLMIRPLAPTKKALTLLERYKISLDDFTTKAKKWSATGDRLAAMFSVNLGTNIKALVPDIDKIINDPQFKGNTSATAQKLNEFLIRRLGLKPGSEDASKIATVVTQFVTSGMKKLDLIGLVKHMSDKQVGIDLWKEMFGLRHIEKGLALGLQAKMGSLQALWKKMQAKLMVDAQGRDPVTRMAERRMKGFAGAMIRLQSAWDVFVRKLGNSGALNDVANVAMRFVGAIERLSLVSPQLLRFATLAVLVTGALAPLGFVVMGVSAVVLPLAAALVKLSAVMVGAGPAIATWAARFAGLAALVMGRRSMIPVVMKLARALSFTGVGIGVALALSHLKELWSFMKGFGKEMFSFTDMDDLDEGAAPTAIQRIFNAFKEVGKAFGGLFKALGLSNEDNDLKAFFDAGVKAAKALAWTIEQVAKVIRDVANGLTWLINQAKRLTAQIGKALGLLNSGAKIQKQSGAGKGLNSGIFPTKGAGLPNRSTPFSAQQLERARAAQAGRSTDRAPRRIRLEQSMRITGEVKGANVKARLEGNAVKGASAATPRVGNETGR